MKSTKSFREGTSIETIAHFTKTAVDELTGDEGSHTIPRTVRITVEVLGADLPIGSVLERFELQAARPSVEKFLEFRRDELRKPVLSVAALRRLLGPFRGRASLLEGAIDESIRHGWRGLFEEKAGNGRRAVSRSFDKEEGSNGGEW